MSRFRNLEFESHDERESSSEKEEARGAAYWNARADDEYRNRLFENALRLYSRALETEVGRIPAWIGQTRCLVWLGEYAEADLWSRKALERFKDNGDLLAALAQSIGRTRKFAPAMETVDRAMKAPGDSAYKWTVRGELLLASRQKTADYCFQRALQNDGEWSTPLEIGCVCVFWDQAAKGIPWLLKATEFAPDQPIVWLELGRAQFQLRQVGPARRSLNECLKMAPGHRDANALLAEIEHHADRKTLIGRIRRLFQD